MCGEWSYCFVVVICRRRGGRALIAKIPRENADQKQKNTTHSKGQDTNQVLFGGGSLAQQQQQTLDRVKETADKGIKIDV